MNRSRLTRTVGVLGAAVIACGVWAGCTGKNNQSAQNHGGPLHADITPGAGFWGEWPKEADPKTQGRKVVANLVARPVIEARDYGMIYPEVCASYGSLRFVGQIKDTQLLAQLVERYQGMLNPPGERAPELGGGAGRPQGRGNAQGNGPTSRGAATRGAVAGGGGARRGGGRGAGTQPAAQPTPAGVRPADVKSTNIIPVANHVDRSVFGILPMEIFRQNGDQRYLAIGKKSADDQWINPTEAGLTNQSRMWIDDMFMVTALQAEAHRVTHDKVYVDRGATEMAAYLDKLQQPNGLFMHADDAPFFWGRGCGWVAAGLTELLTEMPENHPLRPRIMDGYKKLMAGLLKVQAPDGMWRQLLDNDQSWPETSGSGMFTFAMGTGVKKGWLDAKEYKEPARKAWIALSSYLTEDGKVREVCEGTNKGYSVEYYMTRRKNIGDLHGQAAFIWASWAMLD